MLVLMGCFLRYSVSQYKMLTNKISSSQITGVMIGSFWFQLTANNYKHGLKKMLYMSANCLPFMGKDDLMMTSSNGNIFRVTGHLCRSLVNSPHKGQWRGALMFSLIRVWIKGWVNNREAGDLRRYRGHYDVIVTFIMIWGWYGCLYSIAPLSMTTQTCLNTYFVCSYCCIITDLKTHAESITYTVRCRYNAVNFLTNDHKIHPIARPLGQSMGCIFWIHHLTDILSQFL